MVEFENVVSEAWNKEVTFNAKDVKEILKREKELLAKGILFRKESNKVTFGRYDVFKKKIKEDCGHEYVMPDFTDEIMSLMKCVENNKYRSQNILLTGMAGCGKSEFVHEMARRFGLKCVQVNGREDMDSSDFLGDKTVVIDKVSNQNKIVFNKGPLYRAFIEGTELDEEGNQILYNDKGERVFDWTGKPKVIGKPAVFFLDEFATILPSVFLAVFNRAMEIPRNYGENRSIEITADGGRIVKAHPGFMMFLAGNTVGKGTEEERQMGYTAQNNQMDDSTLDRITATYHVGYNLLAEKKIVFQKLKDEKLVEKVLSFVSEIRKQWKEGRVETLLTTRTLVQICEQACLYEDFAKENSVPLAIFRSVFASLREREKAGWNETIRYKFGVNVQQEFENKNKNIWYA